LIEEFIGRSQVKMGQLMNPLRLLIVGSSQGPGMMDILFMIGKEDSLARIVNGIKNLET
jgi:glutamyl-tRNA synthetase